MSLVSHHARSVTFELSAPKLGPGGFPGQLSGGTGFAVGASSRGETYILTNRHVVEGCDNATGWVQRSGSSETASYRVVALSASVDLALVATDMHARRHAEISARGTLERGEELLSFGYPGGYGRTARGMFDKREYNSPHTDDVWYADGIQRTINYRQSQQDRISISAPPGASGSAVFDVKGDVVGVICTGPIDDAYSLMVTAKHIREFLNANGVVSGRPSNKEGLHSSHGKARYKAASAKSYPRPENGRTFKTELRVPRDQGGQADISDLATRYRNEGGHSHGDVGRNAAMTAPHRAHEGPSHWRHRTGDIGRLFGRMFR